jgi:hypothetical protein
MLGIALWPVIPALAHPLGERAATHTLSLVLHRDQVDVRYGVDVPDAFLVPRGGQDPQAAMAVELASGLLLLVDGQVLPMQPLPSPAPAPSSEHTTGFSVHLTAPLPPEARRLELSTANLLEASNLFAQDLRVEPGWRLASASMLIPGPDGRIARDDTLRWRRGDDGRTLSADLAGRWPAWWLWLVQAPDEPVRAARALQPRPQDLLRPTVLTPASWLACALAAALLGASTGRAAAPRALAAAALGLPLALLPGKDTGWVELALAGAALAAWLFVHPRPYPWLPVSLVAAGLAATCHLPGPALGLLLAFGAGALCRPQPHPRLATAGLLLAAVWLLVRGVSAA